MVKTCNFIIYLVYTRNRQPIVNIIIFKKIVYEILESVFTNKVNKYKQRNTEREREEDEGEREKEINDTGLFRKLHY